MHTDETAQAVFQALLDPDTDLPHSARALGLPLSEFLAVADSPAIRVELDALEKLAAIQAHTVIIRAMHSAALALERIAAGDDRPPSVVETCRKAASQILRLAGKSVAPPRDDPESPPDTPPEPTPNPPDDHATPPERAAQDRQTNSTPARASDHAPSAPQDSRSESNRSRVSQQRNDAPGEIPNPAATPDHTAASVVSRLQSAQPSTLREAFNSMADLVGGQAMETHTGRLAFKAGLERLLDTLPDAHIESGPAASEPDGIHALQHFTLRRPNEPPAHFAFRLVADSTAWRLENIIPLAQPHRDSS